MKRPGLRGEMADLGLRQGFVVPVRKKEKQSTNPCVDGVRQRDQEPHGRTSKGQTRNNLIKK